MFRFDRHQSTAPEFDLGIVTHLIQWTQLVYMHGLGKASLLAKLFCGDFFSAASLKVEVRDLTSQSITFTVATITATAVYLGLIRSKSLL